MNRILYIMHVDWNWIKQRPHFIAELLNDKYKIKLLYCLNKDRKNLKQNLSKISRLPFFQLPFRRKYKIIYNFNNLLLKLYFYFCIKIFKPKIIWLTHPYFENYIPNSFKGKIVYDCMDDAIAMEENISKDRLLENEKKLFEKSDLILVSSENLKKKIIDRNAPKEKINLIRNAYNGKILDVSQEQYIKNKDKIKIGYIGTISEWFDFDLILKSLKFNKNIEYNLIGPTDLDIDKYLNDNIIYHSVINHDQLYNKIKDYDCLIMPFKINEIIESVDPVKLYEYINFNKIIISIKYDEINRFEKFTNFYSNEEEYIDLINNLTKNNYKKYSLDERIQFLNDNTWRKRIENIEFLLKNI